RIRADGTQLSPPRKQRGPAGAGPRRRHAWSGSVEEIVHHVDDQAGGDGRQHHVAIDANPVVTAGRRAQAVAVVIHVIAAAGVRSRQVIAAVVAAVAVAAWMRIAPRRGIAAVLAIDALRALVVAVGRHAMATGIVAAAMTIVVTIVVAIVAAIMPAVVAAIMAAIMAVVATVMAAVLGAG